MTSLTRTLLAPLGLADEAVRGIAALPGLAADAADILRLLSEHLPELTGALRRGAQELPGTVDRFDARLAGLEERLDRVSEQLGELAAARRAIEDTRTVLASRLETQLEELRASREGIRGMRADAVDRLDRVSEQLLDLALTRAAAERLVTDVEKVPGI